MYTTNTARTSSFRFDRLILSITKYGILILFLLVTFAPFYWTVVSSLKLQGEIFSPDPTLLPKEPTLQNYIDLFEETELPLWMWNSVVVSLGTTVIGVLLCSLAGFAFAKYQFRGKTIMFWIILSSVSIPQAVTLIPMFTIMAKVGWLDSYQALILPGAANAFGIFLMRQYMVSIPNELLDAARIDGCTELGIFLKIILPLIRPAVGALGIFLWLNSWTQYIWPLVVVESSGKFTMPLGLATLYANPFDLNFGMLMAGAVMSVLPIVIIFVLMQRQFIAGLTQGAVKS